MVKGKNKHAYICNKMKDTNNTWKRLHCNNRTFPISLQIEKDYSIILCVFVPWAPKGLNESVIHGISYFGFLLPTIQKKR